MGRWTRGVVAVAVLAGIGFSRPVVAQDESSLERLSDGWQVLLKSAGALGGVAKVLGTPSTDIQFRGSFVLNGQSAALGTPDETAIVGRVIVEGPDTRSAVEIDTHFLGGVHFQYRRILSENLSFNLRVPEQELIRLDRAEVTRAKSALVGYPPFGLPHVLLAIALSNPSSVRPEDGVEAEVAVSFSNSDGIRITLVVDAETGIPARVEVLGADPTIGDIVQRAHFEDYQDVDGLLIPHHVRFEAGSPQGEWDVTQVALGKPAPGAFFEPPAGLPWTTPPSPLTVEPVGEGLFALRVYSSLGIGYTSLLLVNEDHVTVLEAPLADRLSQATIAGVLAEVAPGLPVRYVVATHHHSDHMGGVRAFAAAGATVVTTSLGAEYLDRVRDVQSQFSPNLLPPGVELNPTIVSDGLTLEGRHVIEVRSVGPTSHADEVLVAYLPADKVLYVADLLSIPETEAMPPIPQVTGEFLRRLEDLGWDIETVVPGHGPAASWSRVLQLVGGG